MSNPYEAPPSNAEPIKPVWRVLSQHDVAKTADLVEQYFLGQKYRLESGTKTDGHYGIGNNVLRILLGAFIKRYRFHVVISGRTNGASEVLIEKGMTGISGGAIGYAKLKKELKRVQDGVTGVVA